MMEAGQSGPLGTHHDGDGVNFAVYSSVAESVELCLFDRSGHELQRLPMVSRTNDIWHGYLPGCRPGQHYGYRVHGSFDLDAGLRCNPNKLLLDPYTRGLGGQFCWSPAVFDYVQADKQTTANTLDSAPFMPKSVVATATTIPMLRGPSRPWAETTIYELNVRGYTMLHPAVPVQDRGKFAGLTNANVLAYLKSLGISSIELMPVQTFIDELFLHESGRRNFWGYNPISFFTPASRYSNSDPRAEFRDMVNAIHDAGMEVLLDIVFNHTGEGDARGPTISFRGLDNLCYYRTEAADKGRYVNDSGCGNTINVEHAQVRALIVECLRYWALDMGVDGFRFDLATVLGRQADGFTEEHPLFRAIQADSDLHDRKFIAEPWDLGENGYQLGHFPLGWGEWNDKYRDSVRRFWHGESGATAEVATRLLGSADIFEARGKGPAASINLVTAHDGYTLFDVVSFEERHNVANGENNADGHRNNYSCNHGVEGPSAEASIVHMRRRQRLNFLATLFLSQGTPMLLGGDEFGNSQQGNNNAYAQDNITGWLDWTGLEEDMMFRDSVANLIALRRSLPCFQQSEFLHGPQASGRDRSYVEWRQPGGTPMTPAGWQVAEAICMHVSPATQSAPHLALLLNPSNGSCEFTLPQQNQWRLVFCSNDLLANSLQGSSLTIEGKTVAVLSTES